MKPRPTPEGFAESYGKFMEAMVLQGKFLEVVGDAKRETILAALAMMLSDSLDVDAQRGASRADGLKGFVQAVEKIPLISRALEKASS